MLGRKRGGREVREEMRILKEGDKEVKKGDV